MFLGQVYGNIIQAGKHCCAYQLFISLSHYESLKTCIVFFMILSSYLCMIITSFDRFKFLHNVYMQ